MLIPHGFETNYVIGFARGLAANGVGFTVVSDDASASRLSAAEIPHLNLRGSVDPGRSICQKSINLVRYYLLLLWTVFRNRGDSLHFCGLLASRMILFEGLFLPVWFRLWAGRYIHTAHNALPHSRETSHLFRRIYRWIYRFPHVIIAHTGKVARQLESEFAVDSARIQVISIGLNEEIPATALSVEEARRQLNVPAGAPLALFFGKVEPYKGADLLVEAWGSVRTPGARLMIAGSCSQAGYAQQIRGAMADSAQAATIEWRDDFIPNGVVAVWLRACDVVVMPYRHIYQSGVLFLCLRFGVPVVATNVGSLAEFIDEESGIITDSNDPAGIAAALERFFSNPTRFQRDDIAHRAAKYRWDRQCLAIKHFYD